MEVNKEEAIRCLSIAKNHYGTGNYASAVKLTKKSISLFPTDDAKAFLAKAEEKAKNQSSATSSGSNPNPSSSSPNVTHREHKAQKREYTEEQLLAVKRIRSCGSDYYKVLSLEKTCTEAEIKKSYRKLALQFHPDKNGAPGADEAFKMISKAFTVLSDSQKRAVFDAGGGDPEQRGGGGGAASMFNQFHQQRYAAANFSDELSPEDLFNAFFGGGGFNSPGFGPGFRSATFVGPGFRTRTFNTGGARRDPGQRQQPTSTWMTLAQLLPLLLLFGVSILSSLFSESTPQFSFDRTALYSQGRSTRQHKVSYYVNPSTFASYEKKYSGKLRDFEQNVELTWVRGLQNSCQNEKQVRAARLNQARGGLFGIGYDEERYQQALNTPMKSCEQLRSFGYNPGYY